MVTVYISPVQLAIIAYLVFPFYLVASFITLHAEIIYTSPFINAEIKIICLRSKWQVLLSKPQAFPAAGFAKVARNKAGLVYLNC